MSVFFRKNIRTIIIIGLVLFLIISTIDIYKRLGSWLVLDDTLPHKADILFVFAGDVQRIQYAAKLITRYSESTLICSQIDSLRIEKIIDTTPYQIKVANYSSSTIDEITFLKKHLGDNSIKNADILLLSSPYHMRRISIMAAIEFRGKTDSNNFFFVPVEGNSVKNQKDAFVKWWKTKKCISAVHSELAKIGYYFIVYLNPFLNSDSIEMHIKGSKFTRNRSF